MKTSIVAVALTFASTLALAGEAPVLFKISVKKDGKVLYSPSFLANVGEPATVRLEEHLAVEALAKPAEADGRAWTQVRVTFFDTPDAKQVYEMSMHHKFPGLRTGSFEYTDPLQRRFLITVGPSSY